jgi:hypothetical protein
LRESHQVVAQFEAEEIEDLANEERFGVID